MVVVVVVKLKKVDFLFLFIIVAVVTAAVVAAAVVVVFLLIFVTFPLFLCFCPFYFPFRLFNLKSYLNLLYYCYCMEIEMPFVSKANCTYVFG